MPDIAQFAQLGVAGLAVYLMYKISANHIDHNTQMLEKNTEILNKLAEAIGDLKEWLENHK